jgi:hypothetical protein
VLRRRISVLLSMALMLAVMAPPRRSPTRVAEKPPRPHSCGVGDAQGYIADETEPGVLRSSPVQSSRKLALY